MSAYTCQNAIDYAANFVKNQTRGSNVDVTIADTVQSMMWIAFPWRWTLNSLTAITLTNGTQDYSVTDTDFYRLIRCRIARTDISPNSYNDVDITQWLPPELQLTGGSPVDFRGVCYEQAKSVIRLDKAAQITSPVVMQIQGEYQKVPTKITALSQNPFMPDTYFDVYSQGVLWKMFEYMEDPRAGAVEVDPIGRKTYSGQLGKFWEAFTRMLSAEDYQDSDAQRFPDNAFGMGRGVNPGLFGWAY